MNSAPTPPEDRILIVAPVGADAHNLVSILHAADLAAAACPTLAAVAAEIENGCGVILLTEEAFNQSRYDALAAALKQSAAVVRSAHRADRDRWTDCARERGSGAPDRPAG